MTADLQTQLKEAQEEVVKWRLFGDISGKIIEKRELQLEESMALLRDLIPILCACCGVHSPVRKRNRVWVHPGEDVLCDAWRVRTFLTAVEQERKAAAAAADAMVDS